MYPAPNDVVAVVPLDDVNQGSFYELFQLDFCRLFQRLPISSLRYEALCDPQPDQPIRLYLVVLGEGAEVEEAQF